MSDLAPVTQATLRSVGWFSGRRVDTDVWRVSFAETGLVMHQAAKEFLAEFGGLQVGWLGAGITRAREAFDLDPMNVWNSEEDRFAAWSEARGVKIFPVGELDHGHALLGIDEQGELYTVQPFGLATFGRLPTGMDGLVLGAMPHRVA
ncbi:SUKH-3 domain-containing protein [Kitasatospora sp. NPDC028055]|uniref:SUKH-3 domain-containing protein n=1 Tax=Kitasatospora sp. NPDC028055 TaxID=3155653 RepID=UPI0033C1E890